MKEKNNNEERIKIIKEGKKIKKESIESNRKESTKKAILLYTVPLAIIVIVGIAYILTQMNILLIVFAPFMFMVLWGGDSSSRTCPRCKKWNSVIWNKTEKRIRTETIKTKGMFNKEKSKKTKRKYLKVGGKCKVCNCEFETEKNRII